MPTEWQAIRDRLVTRAKEKTVNAEKTATAMADVADDIALTFNNGEEQEVLEEGPYKARLINFKVEPKPAWKIERDEARNKAEAEQTGNPPKAVDTEQYAWYWELVEDGFEGHTITDWTNRSFHPKSNGGKYAAYLLGKLKLEGNEGMTTRALLGKGLNLFVTQSNGKNYCSAAKSYPLKKAGKPSLVELSKPAMPHIPFDEDEE